MTAKNDNGYPISPTLAFATLKAWIYGLFSRLMHCAAAFTASERAISAIQYALIAALVALIIVGGANYLGGAVNTKFSAIGSAV